MTNLIKKSIRTAGATVVTFSMLASSAFAQITVPTIPNSPTGDLNSWVINGLNLAIGITAILAVAILIFSGIQYIIANGDEGKIEKATKGITYAVIGLIIAFISTLIVQYVITSVIGA